MWFDSTIEPERIGGGAKSYISYSVRQLPLLWEYLVSVNMFNLVFYAAFITYMYCHANTLFEYFLSCFFVTYRF